MSSIESSILVGVYVVVFGLLIFRGDDPGLREKALLGVLAFLCYLCGYMTRHS